jgi:hypothetical protein
LFLRTEATANNTVLLGSARNGTFTYTALNNDPANGIVAGQLVTVNVLTGQGLNLGTGANQTAFNNAGGVLTVDPVVQSRLLNFIPTAGNLSGTTNGGLTQTFRFNARSNRDTDSFVTRVDYDVNDRNTLNFVYRFIGDVTDRPDANVGFTRDPFVIQDDKTHLFTGAYRTIIGANFTNEVRFGLTQSKPFFNEGAINPDFIIAGAALPFGVTNPEPTFEDQGRNTRLLAFKDDATYVLGDHSLRFGGQYERQKIRGQQFRRHDSGFQFFDHCQHAHAALERAAVPRRHQRDRADARRHAQIFSRRHHRRRRGFGEPDFFDFRRDYRRDSD